MTRLECCSRFTTQRCLGAIALFHTHYLQVCQNCLSDAAPAGAAAKEVQQAVVAAQVEDAISAAFSSLLVDQESCLLQGPCVEPAGLTMLQHVS